MKDFIIVGGGIAGISFAETAYVNDKSFVLFNDASHNSSKVAAGLYNPVILKRFSMPADAKEHLDYIKPFYSAVEARLNVTVDFELPILRRFTSYEEQNDWFRAADKPSLEPFLSLDIIKDVYNSLPAPYGFGRVLHTGYIDTNILLNAYHDFLNGLEALVNESFDYGQLTIHPEHVTYKDIVAKHIIFAEGFGLHANPWFNYLPLDGTKGELLIIKAPDLQLEAVVNGGVFILPLGNDLYKVGATYEWDDKTDVPTDAGRKELVEKLEKLITCSYKIVEHLAGVRPTVKDRKALVGTHPEYKNVHLLNGLGTRAVLLGPPLANELYEAIVSGMPVSKEINFLRFYR